jgi:hypothetical protein
MLKPRLLSLIQPITLTLSQLSLLQRRATNDNDKCKLEKEVESSTTMKRSWLSDDAIGDDDSSDSPEEEASSEETSVNQLNTSKEKLFAKRGRSMIFSYAPSKVTGALTRTTTTTTNCGCR